MILGMQVSVHSLGAPPPRWGSFQTEYRFDIAGPSDEYRTVIVEISSRAARGFELGATENPEAVAKLQRAAVTIALARIASLSSADWADLPHDPDPPARWTIDSKDDLYEALDREKQCSYQAQDGRDLFCKAADLEQQRTTRYACSTICSLPDDHLLCSAASHVRLNLGGDRTPSPNSLDVLCDLGRDEVREHKQCAPGGHACWHRILQLDATPVQREPALALNEAIDFLSFVWAAYFKKKHKLLQATRSHALAEISQSCASREGFAARLSALDDVLGALVVDDDLLSEQFKNSRDKSGKDKTINRIEDAMKKALPKDEHGRLGEPLRHLRAINRIRVGLQHSAKAGTIPTYAERLGLAWRPASWPDAWELVRSRAAQALRDLRQALEASMEASDNVQKTSTSS